MRYCLNKTKGPGIGAFCAEKPEIVFSVFSIAPRDDFFFFYVTIADVRGRSSLATYRER